MNGKGFTVHVKDGQQVKAGDKLITFDRDEIKKAGYKDTIMLIVVENTNELPLKKKNRVGIGGVDARLDGAGRSGGESVQRRAEGALGV